MLCLFAKAGRNDARIGIFVTEEGVAAAEVRPAGPAGEKPQLSRCLFSRIDRDDALTRLVGRLSARRARTVGVLDPADYRLLLVEAPDVPADELRAAVRWRIKDLIDFHIDDAVIDVFELPARGRGGPSRTMYAVTAKAEAVKRQAEALVDAGLKLEAIDILELALRNVAMLLDVGARGVALLYVGERSGILLLVRQGVLYLTRRIDASVRTLADPDTAHSAPIAGVALEVRRSLDYFESHYEQSPIQALYCCGLEERGRKDLASDLGMAVQDVELHSLVETDGELPEELKRRCLPAIGAALRHEAVAL